MVMVPVVQYQTYLAKIETLKYFGGRQFQESYTRNESKAHLINLGPGN